MLIVRSFSLLLILGCCLSNAPGGTPPIPFLCSHVNYAWDYRNDGRFVDSSGKVYTYSFTKADSVGTMSTIDSMSMESCGKLLAAGVWTGVTVPRQQLLSWMSLIEPAGSGSVNELPRCKDAGSSRYSAFMATAADSWFREVVCYQVGDYAICNSSEAAKTIAWWLYSAIDSSNFNGCLPPDSCRLQGTAVTGENPAFRRVRNNINDGLMRDPVTSGRPNVTRVYSLRGELIAEFDREIPGRNGAGMNGMDVVSRVNRSGAVVVGNTEACRLKTIVIPCCR